MSIKFKHIGHWGIITLDKPETLNALDLEMVLSVRAFLQEVELNHDILGVLIHSAVPNVFCAGGDIKAVYHLYKASNQEALSHYMDEEYEMNHQIQSFSKPIVALMDGLTLGGGVGLSRYAKYRIATQRAIVGMPEIKIAFFPDVGSGYFLNVLDQPLARFLALTGYTLKGKDLIDTGYATHLVSEGFVGKLVSQILEHTPDQVTQVVQTHADEDSQLQGLLPVIDCFKGEDLLECIEAIKDCTHPEAYTFYSEMLKFSPLALHIVWRYIEITRGLNYKSVLQIDRQLAQCMFKNTDFFEGIRARLIDKMATPKWRHTSIYDVTEEEVQRYFKFNESV